VANTGLGLSRSLQAFLIVYAVLAMSGLEPRACDNALRLGNRSRLSADLVRSPAEYICRGFVGYGA
jgi:hypothetical protein